LEAVNLRSLIGALAIVIVLAPGAATKTKYTVRARVDKQTSFAALKTYVWRPGWSAFSHTIDHRLVTAIDRELARLGLVRLESEPSDALITYAAIQRTDVDVKADVLENSLARPEYPVGTLLVIMTQPGTRRELFWVRADVPLASEPSLIDAQIDDVVARMFAEYPR
jgi:hypothetical protein